MGTMEEWIHMAREEAMGHPVTLGVTIVFLVVNALILIWWHHPLYGKNLGPVTYPVVGSLPSLTRNAGRILEYFTDEIAKSPTHTMRFVRPGGYVVYQTANVENVEYILKTRFENYVKGEYLGDILEELLGKGIFNVDGSLWKLQRKLASHEFSSRSLREFSFECAEKELEDRLVPILSQVSRDGSVVDLQDLFLRFSFDHICQLGFGVDPNCLEPSLPNVRVMQAFDLANDMTVKRFSMPPVVRKFKKYFNLGTERELKEAMIVVNEFAQGVIQARRKEFCNSASGDSSRLARQDLLSRFMRFTDSSDADMLMQSELEQKCMSDLNLDASDPQTKEHASDVFLRDIVISFILAGRDTTSAALSWFFHALSGNPEVEAKIYHEIKEARSQGESPPDHFLSFEQQKKLHYLNGAIHESLRLFPPVPLDTKQAVRDDALPDGTVMLKGERVTYNVFAMGRMETIWGPYCNEFKPERWLKDGVFVPESSFKFTTFQAGPRICLGKELALIQMKLISSHLIYHFQFTMQEKNPPMTYRSIVFRMRGGLPVRVHPRAH
ncbi:hypothetical protein M758_6G142300 [Ceratodon purpureus]|nr:hypothetical protein M758_6G142300 [Ceratodon purpureus]